MIDPPVDRPAGRCPRPGPAPPARRSTPAAAPAELLDALAPRVQILQRRLTPRAIQRLASLPVGAQHTRPPQALFAALGFCDKRVFRALRASASAGKMLDAAGVDAGDLRSTAPRAAPSGIAESRRKRPCRRGYRFSREGSNPFTTRSPAIMVRSLASPGDTAEFDLFADPRSCNSCRPHDGLCLCSGGLIPIPSNGASPTRPSSSSTAWGRLVARPPRPPRSSRGCGVLHGIIEDTPAHAGEVGSILGSEVARRIAALTENRGVRGA